MVSKKNLGLVFGLAGLMTATPAMAETQFAMSLGQGMAIGGLDMLPFATLDTRLGASFDRWMVYGNLDIWSGGIKSGDANTSVGVHTIGAGTRYMLKDREEEVAVPYLVGGLYTVLPVMDTDDDVDNMLEDVTIIGVTAGFGADYAFSSSFAISGEIGVQHFIASYDEDDGDFGLALTNSYGNLWATFYM